MVGRRKRVRECYPTINRHPLAIDRQNTVFNDIALDRHVTPLFLHLFDDDRHIDPAQNAVLHNHRIVSFIVDRHFQVGANRPIAVVAHVIIVVVLTRMVGQPLLIPRSAFHILYR